MIVIGPDFRVPRTLGPFQIAFLVLWIDTLTKIDAEFGALTITLTSWARDEMQNAAAGGVANSLHRVGLAGDFTVDRGILSGLACGLGGLIGLCRELPIGAIEGRFRRLAPPYTQALREPNGSYHYELDLSG